MYKVYVDGGIRYSDTNVMVGIMIKKGRTIIKKYAICLGFTGTNNIAEYSAILVGLGECKRNKLDDIIVYSDSKLVINQLNNKWKVTVKDLRMFYTEAKTLIEEFEKIKLKWVPRTTKELKIVDKLIEQAK